MIRPNKILICRTDRIGDVVLTLPTAVLLKESFPDVQISFLVKQYTAPIVKHCAAVDEVLIAPESSGKIATKNLIALLRPEKFDAALVVYPRPQIAYACLAAGIPVRIGTASRWYSFLFNHRTHDHRKEVKFHELEYNIRMLKPLGLETNINPQKVKYGIAPPHHGLEDNSFDKLGLTGKEIIIIHPGSGGSAMDWPKNKFAQLINELARLNKYDILITGSSSEADLCKEVAGDNDVKILAGELNLEQLMIIIGKSDIFVANSTGPLHIAAALGKFVIGFYPKIRVCSPERWGPYTSSKAVLTPPIDCTECTREQCERLNCMNTIEVSSVIEQIAKYRQ